MEGQKMMQDDTDDLDQISDHPIYFEWWSHCVVPMPDVVIKNGSSDQTTFLDFWPADWGNNGLIGKEEGKGLLNG